MSIRLVDPGKLKQGKEETGWDWQPIRANLWEPAALIVIAAQTEDENFLKTLLTFLKL